MYSLCTGCSCCVNLFGCVLICIGVYFNSQVTANSKTAALQSPFKLSEEPVYYGGVELEKWTEDGKHGSPQYQSLPDSPPEELNQYEQQRQENIRRNQAFLKSLGLLK